MVAKRKKMRSLRSRIILQMLLISLIPIMVMGIVIVIGTYQSQKAASDSVDESRTTLQEETVGSNKAGLAWLLSYDMEKWMSLRIQEVKSWARSEEIMSAGQGLDSAEKARKFLGDEIINIADFEDAYVVSLSGELLTDEIGYTEPDIESDSAPWQ